MNKLKRFFKHLWFVASCISAGCMATVKTNLSSAGHGVLQSSPLHLSGNFFTISLRTYRPVEKTPFQKRFIIAGEKSSRLTAAMERRIAMLRTVTNDELRAIISFEG